MALVPCLDYLKELTKREAVEEQDSMHPPIKLMGEGGRLWG